MTDSARELTTQPAAPVTLDEQIAVIEGREYHSGSEWQIANAILASLRKLKRIEDMKGLPEPVAETCGSGDSVLGIEPEVIWRKWLPHNTPLYGPEVIALLARERELRAELVEQLTWAVSNPNDSAYWLHSAGVVIDKAKDEK